MPDEPSSSQYEPEPPRDGIPDDFVWKPEYQAWFASGEPSNWDTDEVRAYCEAEWEEKRREGQELLRLRSKAPVSAAPALEVPSSWRKSLRAGIKREHLPLFPDDDTVPAKQEPTPCDPDSDELSEELG